MDCYKLVYKSYKTMTPYENCIQKLQDTEKQMKNKLIYGRLLKFHQSRYPRQLLDILQNEINPFELSLQKLKEFLINKYPQYSSDIVNESVDHIYTKKFQQSKIIEKDAVVIENGDEIIRNGRKLLKQDFTYSFHSKKKILSPDTSFEKSKFQKDSSRKFYGNDSQPNTDRIINPVNPNPLVTSRIGGTSRSFKKNKSVSKKIEAAMLSQRFNKLLAEQIKNEKARWDNIDIFYDNDQNDLVNKTKKSVKGPGDFTDRSQNQSFPIFKQTDIIHNPQGGMDTGRTDFEQLQLLLTIQDPDIKMKLAKQIQDNLFTAQGGLKLDLVRRVRDKLLREKKGEFIINDEKQ